MPLGAQLMVQAEPSPAATCAPAAVPPPASWSPLSTLSNLDSSKKYTVLFLVSAATTLLITGKSGKSLMQRAKRMAAEPASTSAVPRGHSEQRTGILASLELLPPPGVAGPAALAPLPNLIPFSRPARRRRISPALADLASSFPPLAQQHRSLLKQWSQDKGTDLSFWLPNTTLTADSIAAAHDDELSDLPGAGQFLPPEGAAPYIDDGVNPAVFAAKAFLYATALTLSAFGLGVWGVMRWYHVSDVRCNPVA